MPRPKRPRPVRNLGALYIKVPQFFVFLFFLLSLQSRHYQIRGSLSPSIIFSIIIVRTFQTFSRATNTMSVPVVDFSPFYHGTALEQAQLATRITQELQKNGAVRLVNHKISAEMISECYEWVSSPQSVPSCISTNARKQRARIMPDLVPTE